MYFICFHRQFGLQVAQTARREQESQERKRGLETGEIRFESQCKWDCAAATIADDECCQTSRRKDKLASGATAGKNQ